MLQIVLHSSKTMTAQTGGYAPLGTPHFKSKASQLAALWQEATSVDIARYMQVSSKKAAEVKQLYEAWSYRPNLQTPAIDAFRGDIYSGLQVATWSATDRAYAHKHLSILSGLYGALRACDGIMPYRLEMGYKLPDGGSMYGFWGDTLVRTIPDATTHLINLSAVEYTKALLPYVTQKIITPKFMTISPKSGQPAFVTVHAKIARGAFARWMIQRRITKTEDLSTFSDLGYCYDARASTAEQPVFVCEKFQGLGLSVRT